MEVAIVPIELTTKISGSRWLLQPHPVCAVV